MKNSTSYNSKKLHFAKDISSDGSVSVLCFIKQRKINTNVASWTLSRNFVSCEKCLKILKEENISGGAM